jgi:hypothetical protein
MNDPNWSTRSFEPLVERLEAMGAQARLPGAGENVDAYLAEVFGWMLDVLQPSQNAKAKQYWNSRVIPPRAQATDPSVLLDRDAAKLIRGEQTETPKAHVTEESGRSYKIEGAVVDGKVIKPGEPMPPAEGK